MDSCSNGEALLGKWAHIVNAMNILEVLLSFTGFFTWSGVVKNLEIAKRTGPPSFGYTMVSSDDGDASKQFLRRGLASLSEPLLVIQKGNFVKLV